MTPLSSDRQRFYHLSYGLELIEEIIQAKKS